MFATLQVRAFCKFVRSAHGHCHELSVCIVNAPLVMSASSEADDDARTIVLNVEMGSSRHHVVAIYLRKLIAAAIRADMVDTVLVITDAMDTTGWSSVISTENHAALLVGAKQSTEFRMALLRYCACIDSPSSRALATRLALGPIDA